MKRFRLGSLAFCLSSVAMAADICFLYDDQIKNEFHFCYYHCPAGDKVITIGKYERCDNIHNFSSINGKKSEKYALSTQSKSVK